MTLNRTYEPEQRRCPAPEFISPVFDSRLAPYQPNGCISPLMLTGITRVSSNVELTLTKPGLLQRLINLTLQIEGSDSSRLPAWRVLEPEVLAERSPWLSFPALSGEMDVLATELFGEWRVNVGVAISAKGLRERDTPYTETLPIEVRSGISTATRTQYVEVTLTVQAKTSFVAWGRFRGDHEQDGKTDPRRFSAEVDESFREPKSLSIEYLGDGLYEILLELSVWGGFSLSLSLDGLRNTEFKSNSTCPDDRVSLTGGRCGCKSGYFQPTEAEPCTACTPQSTSSAEGAVGSASCDVCKQGFYRPTASDPSRLCTPCPLGAQCDFNTTLPTLHMQPGFWRLSPYATTLLPCAHTEGEEGHSNSTPEEICLPGASVGTCAAGYGGPQCLVCTHSSQYMEESKCVDCPQASAGIAITGGLGVVAAVCLLAWCMLPIHRERYASLPMWMRNLVSMPLSAGLFSKVRILISFYQCVSVIGSVFLVELPEAYRQLIKWLAWINLDWLRLFVAAECVGSFEHRLLLLSFSPLVLIAFVVLYQLLSGHFHGQPIKQRLRAIWYPCLLIIFLFSPTVNRKIFETWDCTPYEYSANEKWYYMRSSLSIRCDSSSHHRISSLAYALVAIWPVGSMVLYSSLVLAARRRLLERRPDEFVASIKFLHADFKPEYYFWAAAELLHRSSLTGWVLLIRAEHSMQRLMIAFFISLTMLLWTLLAQPYREIENNMVAVLSSLLLVLTYTLAFYIKVYEDITEGAALLGIPHLAEEVLGFNPSSTFAVLLIVLTVWKTGQDQAALVKRRLQLMLPSISIFLDVDNLDCIGNLEQYIEQSACILLFFTQGYLKSRNCIREVRHAVGKNKPQVQLLEMDRSKGGVSLVELRDNECPVDLVEALFRSEVKTIPWYRAHAFQLLSLKLLAEQLLLNSPEYMGKMSLPLSIKGELLDNRLHLEDRKVLYVSKSNPGAIDAARQLKSRYDNLSLTSRMTNGMAMRIDKEVPQPHHALDLI
ncbi:MAG: hypothetical protein SGPRY_001671 [Prymnesium sp.]